MARVGEQRRRRAAPVVLLVSEVAKKLRITDQQVLNLIEEGAIAAINVGGGSRKFWRIPIVELDKFAARRSSMNV